MQGIFFAKQLFKPKLKATLNYPLYSEVKLFSPLYHMAIILFSDMLTITGKGDGREITG